MEHKIIIISCPFPIRGGGRRSLEILRRLPNHVNQNVEIIFPPDCVRSITTFQDKIVNKTISDLINKGIEINECSLRLLESLSNSKQFKIGGFNISEFLRRTFSFAIYKRENFAYLKNCLKFIEAKDVCCVYSHHEWLDSVLLSYLMAEKLKKYLIILLQLEPLDH